MVDFLTVGQCAEKLIEVGSGAEATQVCLSVYHGVGHGMSRKSDGWVGREGKVMALRLEDRTWEMEIDFPACPLSKPPPFLCAADTLERPRGERK